MAKSQTFNFARLFTHIVTKKSTRFFIEHLFRTRWEDHVEETSRGRARTRRPDPINLKDEAKTVRFREKSQKRESRHARRAASAGRLNGEG